MEVYGDGEGAGEGAVGALLTRCLAVLLREEGRGVAGGGGGDETPSAGREDVFYGERMGD